MGLLSLTIGCAFAGICVRSLFVADVVSFWNSQCISNRGGIFWERATGQVEKEDAEQELSFTTIDGNHIRDLYNNTRSFKWRWRGLGFAHGEQDKNYLSTDGTQHTVKLIRYYVPYWSLVAPFVLISVYLLLPGPWSKHRKTSLSMRNDGLAD